MSSREKRLLTLFAIAGFAMLNLVGFSIYNKKAAALETRRLKAEQTLDKMRLFEASREQRHDEMKWLETHLPVAAENQNVQTALQAVCVSTADKYPDLTIKDEDLLPSITDEGEHFHRARIRLKLTGREQALYKWISEVRVPEQLRNVTELRLSPNSQDDTLIDCEATVEQWFVPVEPKL
ncbi:MAG: hypothetical protein R3242_07445 [Akkermansiaceae bacterium]|nr:hypothetical protein [Akkermansiaceae bacterium]